ncbi:MAG: insulinase family protein [Bacilli bacterium]
MEKIGKVVNNISVKIIKTDKFKTISGGLFFKSPITKEKMTIRNLLGKCMIYSCEKYKTNEELNKYCLEKYDPFFASDFGRTGNYYINTFLFSSINDKYIDDFVIDDVIDLFCEIVFNPNVKNEMFDKKTFELQKQRFGAEIDALKENPKSYAKKKLVKIMDETKPYSFTSSREVLDKITSKDLYNEYLDLVNNSEIELVLVGDFDFDKVANTVTSHIQKSTKYNESFFVSNGLVKKVKDEKETFDSKQSILAVGLKTEELSDFERSYVVPFYNNILGGGPSSRLFQIIREENSLAYFSSSSYQKSDGIIEIISGINRKDYEKGIIGNMVKVDQKEVDRCRKELYFVLKEMEDYKFRLIDLTYFQTAFNEPEIDEKIANFNKVTVKDIEDVSKKVKLDSAFFLEGGQTDEEN